MNERIKLLAVEADKWVADEYHLLFLNNVNPNRQELFNKKFAELIVTECLDACSRANEIRHFVPPTQEQVVLSCMREIEKHFKGN